MNQRIDGNIINSKNHTRRPCQAGYCENAQKGGMRGGALNNPHWQPVKTRWVATQVTTHAAMLGLQRPYGFRAQVTSMFRNRQALSQRGHTEDQTQTCRPLSGKEGRKGCHTRNLNSKKACTNASHETRHLNNCL